MPDVDLTKQFYEYMKKSEIKEELHSYEDQHEVELPTEEEEE
jgi:hypothetical protein